MQTPPSLLRVSVLMSFSLYGVFDAAPVVQRKAVTTNAPGPFQFREVYLLENRVETKTQPYDPSHSENMLSQMNWGLANPFMRFNAEKRDRPITYQGSGWVDLLRETDKYRQMGGLDVAEKQYLDIVENLIKAQGTSSSHLSLMLDHLAEFYLEERKFDQAYKTFTQALQVQRRAISEIARVGVAPNYDPSARVENMRVHVSELLTRLGRLDLTKGTLASAGSELAEAVAIVNLPENLKSADGLYSIYFFSRVLESQSKWGEAEKLWYETTKLREKFSKTVLYAETRKEMAAFYARKGDFHSAAEIAQTVQERAAANNRVDETPQKLLENRPITPELNYLYAFDSATAMSEIMAVDAWQSKGAEAACALLANPVNHWTDDMMDRGSDSERTQLLAWFSRKAYLHMSILLDGSPTQDRIDTAYTLISAIKGRYLASIGEKTRSIESNRGNPDVQIPDFEILDQLGAVRQNQARLFISAELFGKDFDSAGFAANDNRARILSSAIVSSQEAAGVSSVFSIPTLVQSVPPNAAFIDLFVWEKSSRDSKIPPQREYGAFVVRNGQPVRYVRIGLAGSVDADIDTLLQVRREGLHRSVSVGNQPVVTPADFRQRLSNLYMKVIAPMEDGLQGAANLYIVPDGKLALAPVSAFKDKQGRYLLETRTINYMKSWRDLTSTVIRGSAKSSPPLIVANPDFDLALQGSGNAPVGSKHLNLEPLPGALEEAADIKNALQVPQDRVLVGKAARKSLVQSIQNPEILHLATHSQANFSWTPPAPQYALFEFPEPLETQYPLLQSFVALAGANRPQDGIENGYLTGLEVTSLHLSGTRLVVLSACESGQGTILDGQGVLGLRAAFAMAGAEALVMTLWPVDDSASRQFMQLFYSHLSEGPAQAVRMAQQEMLRSTRFADPRDWSGYIASENIVVKSEQKIAATRRSEVPKPASSSPAALTSPDSAETLVSPACFELRTHDSSRAPDVYFGNIRIKVGGVVRKAQTSSGQVTYDLHDVGNDVEVTDYETVNGIPVIGSASIKLASERNWLVQLAVSRESDSSSLSFRFGPDREHPSKNRVITLKGGPNLFPTLDIPATLPPLSSYIQATDSYISDTIDHVGACAAESPRLPPQTTVH